MFTHSKQDSVWSEGHRSQAETLPGQDHGSCQQWLQGEQIVSQKYIDLDHEVMFAQYVKQKENMESAKPMALELTLSFSMCLSVMVLQRSGSAGHRLYESSGSPKIGSLQPAIYHCIHGNQLQSVGT